MCAQRESSDGSSGATSGGVAEIHADSAPFATGRRALAVALGTWLVDRFAHAASGKLLVFLHVAAKQRAFQSELEGALPGITVTAVGRIGDFERALKEGQDAVLTLPVVLAAHGLDAKLHGQRQGATEESYALVGVDKAPDPATVPAVGALDVLGREGMNGFIHDLLGGRPKVERVTKVEDLLPLLQMQRVAAIVLPLRLLGEIKAASRLNLVERPLATKIGLPAVAGVGAASAGVLAALGHLPRKLLEELGVDRWR